MMLILRYGFQTLLVTYLVSEIVSGGEITLTCDIKHSIFHFLKVEVASLIQPNAMSTTGIQETGGGG